MRRVLAIAFTVLLLAAACGDDEGDRPAPTIAAPTTQAAAAPTTAAGPSIGVATSDLGAHLVDESGRTLYLFTVDSQGGGASACSGDCAVTWPPLTGAAGAADGVDAGLLATITRDDGTTQATYNGWPLYYFAADAAPGDTNGQGVGEVWFVVSPAGDAIG